MQGSRPPHAHPVLTVADSSFTHSHDPSMAETPTIPGTKYLDPAALARLKNLGLAARLVGEGLFTG